MTNMNNLRNRFQRLRGVGGGGTSTSTRRSLSSSRSSTTSSSRRRGGQNPSTTSTSSSLRRYHSLDIINDSRNNDNSLTPYQANDDAPSDRTVVSNDNRTNATIGRGSIMGDSSSFYNSTATFHYDSNTTSTLSTTTTNRRRRARQLGRHKNCCGGFCLRVGDDDNDDNTSCCCLHAPGNSAVAGADATERGGANHQRFCSFCYDRRREEQRRLRLMEQQQQQQQQQRQHQQQQERRQEQQRVIMENMEQQRLRLQLMMREGSSSSSSWGAPADAMAATSASVSASSGILLEDNSIIAATTTISSTSRRSERDLRHQRTSKSTAATAIPKACCGGLCTGPTYTHCCEHNELRSIAGGDSRKNGYYYASGIHHGSLIPNFESYCTSCLDRCRQQRRRAPPPGSRGGRSVSSGDGGTTTITPTTNEGTEAAVSPDHEDDNCSVDAVRLMPPPAGRSRMGPTLQQQQQGWIEQRMDNKTMTNRSALQQVQDNTSICNSNSNSNSTNNKLEKAIIDKCWASIECPVCLEPFGDDPCTLPCGHSMCMSHIYNMDRCPICRWVFEQPQQQQKRMTITGRQRQKKDDWKALAQPSIALRESASAMKEALSFMMLARKEAAAAAKRKGREEEKRQSQQKKKGQELEEDCEQQDILPPPFFCQPVTVVNCQWSPPKGHQKVEVTYSDTSTATTTSHSSTGEEEEDDDDDEEERMTTSKPSSSKRSTNKKKHMPTSIPRIGVSVEC